MAENDIYNSKGRYEHIKNNLAELTETSSKREYVCQNSENIKYVEKLFLHFEAQDVSFVRRLRLGII